MGVNGTIVAPPYLRQDLLVSGALVDAGGVVVVASVVRPEANGAVCSVQEGVGARATRKFEHAVAPSHHAGVDAVPRRKHERLGPAGRSHLQSGT